MGADMIGQIVTVDASKHFAEGVGEKVAAYIKAMPEAELQMILDAGNCEIDDYLEGAAMIGDDDAVAALRLALLEGAETLLGSSRYQISTPILGTPLSIIFKGAPTWGDDPYDGYLEEAVFIEAAMEDALIAREAGIVTTGAPDAETVWQYSRRDR
jgi:hypothetical protein